MPKPYLLIFVKLDNTLEKFKLVFRI